MNPVMVLVKEKAEHMDTLMCLRMNRWIRDVRVHRFFSTISRLGDGILWYVIMLVLPVFLGAEGFVITALMMLMACWGVFTYKHIKSRSMRCRPFVANRFIKQGAKTLDQFSFPSGHTMHAVAFTILLLQAVPGLGVLLIPFAVLTGLARIVLGLHYPSDVFMGGVLGIFNAALILTLFGGFL